MWEAATGDYQMNSPNAWRIVIPALFLPPPNKWLAERIRR